MFGFLLLLTFALNFPYLSGGFHADDFLFLNLLRQDPLPFSRWGGLWSMPVEDSSGFRNLWWFEEGTTAFLVYLLFRRLRGDGGSIPFLASLVFVTCEDHSMGIGWIATITDLICVTFLLCALLGYERWRRRHRPADLALVLLPLALALASKETAVIGPVLILLTEWILPGRADGKAPVAMRSAGDRLRALLRRWPVWSPAVVLLAVYLIVYRTSGVGGMHNLMYTDPLVHPFRYLRHLALHFPVMILATATPVPPSLVLFDPDFLVPMAAAGALLGIAVVIALLPLRRDRVVVWSCIAYLLVLLPQMGTDASERLLYFPLVPASYLLASLLGKLRRPRWRRGRREEPSGPPGYARVAGWLVLLGTLLPGAILSGILPTHYLRSLRMPEVHTLTALEAVRDRRPERVIVLNTSGPFLTFYIEGIYEYHLGRNQPAAILSSLSGRMTLERLDDRSFLLRTDRPGWLGNLFARIVRWNERLTPGAVYRTPAFEATLRELTADRRDALTARFDFPAGLADPRLLFLRWDGERFVPIDLSTLPVGVPIPLADTSDPFRSMMSGVKGTVGDCQSG